MRNKNREKQPDCGTRYDQCEEEQDESKKDVGGAQVRDCFLFQKLVLLLAEEPVAGPVLQESAGTQSLFA
jgi:hypothetical protein